jgi:hypothetical protein
MADTIKHFTGKVTYVSKARVLVIVSHFHPSLILVERLWLCMSLHYEDRFLYLPTNINLK